MPQPPVTVTNEQRQRVRAAITSHPNWPAYRAAHMMSSAELDRRGFPTTLQAAQALGIDVPAILRAAPRPSLRDWTLDAPGTPKAPATPAGSDAPAGAATEPGIDQTARDWALAAGTLAREVSARVAALESAPKKLVVVREGKPNVEVEGRAHPMLETLLKAVSAKTSSGSRLNIWIAGPTGTGKSHAATQVAQALGLEFGFHGAMTMAPELTGFIDAYGKYHETAFVKRFRDGGVILLDEIDAGSNEALLAINAPLANGMVSLPTGEIVRRHPDCVVIGAANTFGQGPTAEYIGRCKIDAAFMSRFAVRLHWTNDDQLERDLCGNVDWAIEVQKARRVAQEKGIKVVIDSRQSIAGAALIAAGFTPREAADMTYLATMTPDQRSIIRRETGGL